LTASAYDAPSMILNTSESSKGIAGAELPGRVTPAISKFLIRPVNSLCLKVAPMVTLRTVSNLGAQNASEKVTLAIGTGAVG